MATFPGCCPGPPQCDPPAVFCGHSLWRGDQKGSELGNWFLGHSLSLGVGGDTVLPQQFVGTELSPTLDMWRSWAVCADTHTGVPGPQSWPVSREEFEAWVSP